jgi:hypothetical protein
MNSLLRIPLYARKAPRTPQADKRLLVLEGSRHGAENRDREILQEAVSAFI